MLAAGRSLAGGGHGGAEALGLWVSVPASRGSTVGPTVSDGQRPGGRPMQGGCGSKVPGHSEDKEVSVIDFGTEWLNSLFFEKKTQIQIFRAGGGRVGAGLPVTREPAARQRGFL